MEKYKEELRRLLENKIRLQYQNVRFSDTDREKILDLFFIIHEKDDYLDRMLRDCILKYLERKENRI